MTLPASVLIVDDDRELGQMLTEYLTGEGFQVSLVRDGAEALERLAGTSAAGAPAAGDTHPFDLVILDGMLPSLSGFEVLRRLRHSLSVPVIMLTAHGADVDRIVGLELGADDYVTKPCTPRELTARIRAILRRTQAVADSGSGPLVVGQLSMWPEQRRAAWAGVPLDLTSTEFNLLEVLARNAGKPVSKNVLSEQGLGRPMARFDRNIDVHMSSLRHKLGSISDGRSCLQTVYRLGYQLIRE